MPSGGFVFFDFRPCRGHFNARNVAELGDREFSRCRQYGLDLESESRANLFLPAPARIASFSGLPMQLRDIRTNSHA